MTIKRILAILLTLVLLFTTACADDRGKPSGSQPSGSKEQTSAAAPQEETSAAETEVQTEKQTEAETGSLLTELNETTSDAEEPSALSDVSLPEYSGYYYDVTNVVLYIDLYGELPPNFITKAEARELGWQGGSVEDYIEGGAIGGDYFGNYEELLPKANGRTYTECDIDTKGYHSRGSRRLIFSNDGLYFYTSDHYESFSQVFVTEDHEVIW